MKFKLPCGNREYYLQRTPECLVVEGYRRWVAGYETGSIEPWEIAWSYYSRELGAVEGRRALADLSCFVRELRTCATCPLRMYPCGAKRLCRDECLAAALIAACQHGDVKSRATCLKSLAGCGAYEQVEDTARRFAATLDRLGQVLMPIPASVVDEIANTEIRVQYH